MQTLSCGTVPAHDPSLHTHPCFSEVDILIIFCYVGVAMNSNSSLEVLSEVALLLTES